MKALSVSSVRPGVKAFLWSSKKCSDLPLRKVLALALLLVGLGSRKLVADGNLTELRDGWRMISAKNVTADGAAISQPSFDASSWYKIARMPATVLETLEENGVYPDLYFGMNMAKVPPDLYKQDWWYRTTFTAPAGREIYTLILDGINYRADVWLNGTLIGDHTKVVGMYNSFELDDQGNVKPGQTNALAIKITPEQKLLGVDGVELGEGWLDWINFKYFGYRDPVKHIEDSFVPDRNAGVWKKVFLSSTGRVAIRHPYVASDLPLPALTPAALTVYCDLRNGGSIPVSGTLHGEITRAGKPTMTFQQEVSLAGNETKEVTFTPAAFPQLTVEQPDLWWPYQWGPANLYQLKLEFVRNGVVSDAQNLDFGIHKITQHRDTDNQFPQIGTGGNFYLQVNGKDFQVRGADYTPDLLFKNDPEHDQAVMSYVKDLGLNLLRWEAKMADEAMVDLADREGVPVMQGWMCCAQWEAWDKWDAEDQWVARESQRAQIYRLRPHASAFIWANGSDGLAPEPLRNDYHQILKDLHWQSAIVDTVAHFKKDKAGHTLWDGIHMAGPYSWRPPSYWFRERYAAPRGSDVEQGDNEHIPPLDSLVKLIPESKLWPINEYWYYHAGGNPGNAELSSTIRALEKRYGPSNSAVDFTRKAQLAHYENTRAQFESFSVHWPNHKMTVYWMLNNQWPSFFGHLFDYYLNPGGAYFGAKHGLRPLNVIFDYYATGDRQTAYVYVTNQSIEPRRGLKVSVKVYNLDGSEKFSREFPDFHIGADTSAVLFAVPRVADVSPVYFVRCQIRDGSGALLADNLYWQSTTDDELGDPANDKAFYLNQKSWSDFTPLNHMPGARVSMHAESASVGQQTTATISVSNNSNSVAFFLRVEVTRGEDGEAVLPILYEDNYVTLLPKESRTIKAHFSNAALDGRLPAIRIEGYNVAKLTGMMNR